MRDNLLDIFIRDKRGAKYTVEVEMKKLGSTEVIGNGHLTPIWSTFEKLLIALLTFKDKHRS